VIRVMKAAGEGTERREESEEGPKGAHRAGRGISCGCEPSIFRAGALRSSDSSLQTSPAYRRATEHASRLLTTDVKRVLLLVCRLGPTMPKSSRIFSSSCFTPSDISKCVPHAGRPW
jgi:hypothetical protein